MDSNDSNNLLLRYLGSILGNYQGRMPKLTSLSQDEMDNVIYDARFGDLESLKDIFTNEVDPKTLINIQDGESLTTPIHMAAANGNEEVIKYLLSIVSKDDAKKLINKQNDSGNTSLHWAALNGHLNCVEILIEFGGDPFIRNNYKHDVFHEASSNDNEDLEDYLLKKFCTIDDEESEEEKSDNEFDESKVKYSEGTEIEKANTEAKVAKDTEDLVNDLKEKTDNLKVES